MIDISPSQNLSIHERIRRLSKWTVMALFLILGTMAFASYTISSSMKSGLKMREDMEIVKNAQFRVIQIALASMDIIVDKADGQVMPERIKELEDSMNYIESKALPLVLKVYTDNGQKEKYDTLVKSLQTIKQKSQIELVQAVENRAPDETFGALDDSIDGLGEDLVNQFGDLSETLQTSLVKSLNSSKLHSTLLVIGNILIFILVSIGAYFVIRLIQRTIVDPMEQITTDTIQVISKAATDLNHTTAHLNELMADAATRITKGSREASIITQSVEGVAAAVEELTSSIGEIRRQATISTEVSGLAVKEAMSMSETINSLNTATQGIGEITDLINKIAESTNLLALNATIEAARAGEAGEGFAVVATEVKNLAVKTAEATDDISNKVREMQEMSSKAVSAIGNIQDTISEINNANSNVMASVEQQSAATGEINRTLSEATDGLKGTSEMIAGIDVTIQETKEDAGLVFTSGGRLLDEASNMQRKTNLLINGAA